MVRGFESEILFSECDWNLVPFWSRNWTVVDDGFFASWFQIPWLTLL
jgi:hypothetical protein